MSRHWSSFEEKHELIAGKKEAIKHDPTQTVGQQQ